MADVAWYIGEGGQKRGPYNRDDVDAFVRSGRVRRDTLVWCDGMANWESAEAAGLFGAVPAGRGAVAGPVAMPAAGPGLALRRFFANYAAFGGRASRAEFWWPTLAITVVATVAVMADLSASASGGSAFLGPIVFFATLVPSLAVTARRLHDTDKTAWLMLIAFVPFGQLVLFVLCAMRGSPGPNRFGDTL